MHAREDCTTYRLEPSQQQLLASAAPGLLMVTNGIVWLTRGDGSEDHILAAGDCISFGEGGKPIASALGGSAAFEITLVHEHVLPRAA